MAEGIIARLDAEWNFGVIATSDGFLTFPGWNLDGDARPGQRVTFEATGNGDARHVVPGPPGDLTAIPGCPQCDQAPIDVGVRTHQGRLQRDVDVYATVSCTSCGWRQPETLASVVPNSRGPGCGTLLLVLVFPPYPLFRYAIPTGWQAANKLLQPKHATVPVSDTLNALQTARTVVGFLVVAAAVVYFGGEAGLNSLSEQIAFKAVAAIAVGLLALVVGISAFALLTHAGEARRELLARARRHPPVVVLHTAGMALSMFVSSQLFDVYLQLIRNTHPLIGFGVAVAGLMVVGYAVGFWARALFLVGKNVFNAVEVHPLLPSVLTPAIAWVVAAMELLQGGPLPTRVQTLLTLSGACVVTILAVAEWLYYRKVHAVRVRTGPHPHKPPETAPQPR